MNSFEVFLYHPDWSAKYALKLIREHDADWAEFVADYGQRDTYDGADVLMFLGY
jgi:hypothetical protein